MGVAVEIPSDSVDSAPYEPGDNPKTTSFKFAAGSGAYGRNIHASRIISLGYDSCTGQESTQYVHADFRFKSEFTDYGAEIDHQVSETFHVGVRGGAITESASYLGSTLDASVVDTLFAGVSPDTTWTQWYANPFISFEKETWGLGLGVVFSDRPLWSGTEEYGNHDDNFIHPTGHFRLGILRKAYANVSLWEGVPVYSGGALWVAGFGARPVSWLELWAGFGGGGPYTRDVFMARANVDLGRHLTLGTHVRFPEGASDEFGIDPPTERAASVSLTYKLLRD